MASTPPSRAPTRAAFSLATPYSNELPGTHPPSVRGRFLEQGWPAWTFRRFERGAPPPEEEDEEEAPRGTAAGSATFRRTTKEARCDFHEDRKGSPTAGSPSDVHRGWQARSKSHPHLLVLQPFFQLVISYDSLFHPLAQGRYAPHQLPRQRGIRTSMVSFPEKEESNRSLTLF